MQLHFEHGVFARQVFRLVILRERDLHVELLAGFAADDLVLKPGDELPRPEDEAVVLGLAARKRLAADPAVEVDVHDVALLGLAVLHRHHARVAVAHPVDFRVHVRVRRFHALFGHCQALVALNLCFRLRGDGRFENQAFLAGGNHVKVDFVLDHLDVCFADRLLQRAGINGVDGVIVEDLLPVVFFDEFAGRLALAESRDGDLPFFLAIRLINRFLKRVGIHRNFKLDAVCIDFTG